MPNKKIQKSVYLRIVGYVINKIWLLFATLIIGLATFFLMLELLLPEVNRYKLEIVDWIEKNYQIDIEVDAISVKWSTTGPSISLINFSVLSDDKSFNLFEVGSLSVEFDFLASILNQEYSTHAIQLQNANMRFYIDSKLGVKLNTFSVLKDKTINTPVDAGQIEGTSKRFFELLVAQKKIEIHNSKLEIMTLRGSSFNYKVDDLTVKKYLNHHQLIGHLTHIEESINHSNSIKLIAEVHTGAEENDNYTNLYLDIDNVDLASLPKVGYIFEEGVKPKIEERLGLTINSNNTKENSGKTNASLSLWARWKNRHWQTMDAQISLNGEKKLSAILSWRNEDYHHGYAELHDLIIGKDKVDSQNVNSDISDSSYIDKDNKLEDKVLQKSETIIFKYSHEEKENIFWNLAIKDFNLSPVLNYLPSVLSKKTYGMNWLDESDVSLQLEHLKVSFIKNKQKWSSSDLTLQFSNVKTKRQKNIPTFSDLSGWVLFDTDTRFFQSAIYSDSSELNIDELFREKISVNKFIANVTSDLSNGFSELNISNMIFENVDLKLNADAKFYFDDDEPNLSLKAKIDRGDVSQTFRYLPTGIMSNDLVKYLDSSIKSGDLFATNAVLRGPIKKFPYPNNSGVFAVLAKVNDVTYRYLPEWPLVTKVSAELLFEGTGMLINVDTAQSLSNQLTSAEVGIIDMTSDDSKLDLILNINSDNNQGRAFLKETPLDFISDGLKNLDFNGQMKTHIDLKVPLSKQIDPTSELQEPELAITLLGSVQPIGNTLNLNLPFVEVKSVKGKLVFDEGGIIKSEMSGYVDEKLVQAKIQSMDKYDVYTKEYTFMQLDLEGVFASTSIDQFIDGHWSRFLSGEASFNGKILFMDKEVIDSNAAIKAEKQSKIKVSFNSDLNGVAFDMPDFLHKKQMSSESFQLDLEFFESQTYRAQQGKIAWKELDAEWLLETDMNQLINDKPKSKPTHKYSTFINLLAIQLSSETQNKIQMTDSKITETVSSSIISNEKWNHPNGITVQGNIKKIHLMDWIDFSESIRENYSIASIKNMPSNDEDSDLLVNKIELSINEILIPGVKELSSVKITADKYIDLPWRLSFKSNQGNTDVIFDENSPWLVNAEEIDINFSDTTTDNEGLDAKVKENFEVKQFNRHLKIYSSLPEMDIKCNLCQFNKKNLGNFRASVRKNEENNNISLEAKIEKGLKHQISLSGIWSMSLSEVSNQKNIENTEVNFALSTDNVGTLLKHWGFQPSIEDSKGKVIGSLNWHNSPWRMDYKNLNGYGRLDFGKGYLSQISDEDGRIIALFNLKSILRKLTFDFKDVYKKGFFYESMDGTVKIDNGVISTYDTKIKGNVADVRLFGITDLKNEKVEQHAIVSPHITSSFPVLAAWALEPTTGIIIYLLNKIMEPAIEVATQIDYRVHGSFDKPIVDEIKKSKKRVKINLDEQEINKEQNDELNKDNNKSESKTFEKIINIKTETKNTKINIKKDAAEKNDIEKDDVKTTVIKENGDNNG